MSKVAYKTTVSVEIDIRRPTGQIETVDVSHTYHRMTDAAFAKIKAATKAAGRGDAIAYRNIEEDSSYTLDAVDLVDTSHDRIVSASGE